MAATEGEQTEAAPDEIKNVDELKTKLANASGVASFKLMNDVVTSETITLSKDGSNITLDLNGCKIKHTSQNQTLFKITGGATLTVKDGQQVAATEITTSQTNKCGNLALMEYDTSNGIPTGLTYYVTESVANGTRTTETLKAYKAHVKGAIVACSGSKDLRLIVINSGGHLNLESGMITQDKNNCVKNLVYAAGSSAISVDGGYVCGGYCPENAAGAGISVENSTLDISGGVIAGNYAPSGGGVYALNSTVNMVDGIISGNGTNNNQSGYGAGICAEYSNVNITNGYITNNSYQHYIDQEGNTKHLGNGCHGGGGIAAWNGGSLTIVGGYITGNYSAEAGGGVYAGVWNKPLSGFTFSGGIIASNVAQNSEGGGIRIAAPTVGEFNVSGKKAYITNNTTNTSYDWGGGGVFVQGGNSDQNIDSASLKIYNALINNNSAQGYGGGFAACPTGKTSITDTNGIAIFGNTDADGKKLSGDGNEKKEDWLQVDGGEITPNFKKNNGHKDLFLIHKKNDGEYIAAVTGQMLGGGAANWTGTIDDSSTPIYIGKYEGAQAKYMIGLDADPSSDDQGFAVDDARLFITGNKSNIHGGGIMTNGDVIAGSTTEVNVYPKMKLNGTKELKGRNLKKGEFEFELLKQGSNLQAPSFNDKGALQPNGCQVVDTVQNDTNGSFTFDLGEVYADTNLVYYLVEKPGAEKDITYSKTIYKIEPTVTKDTSKSHDVLKIRYTYYKVDSVKITKTENGKASESTVNGTSNNDVVSIQLTNDTTFTNEYTQYTSSGSWTPKATKVVKGGEMKEFKLEFADNENFANAKMVKTVPDGENVTTADGDKSQTLSFDEITYTLADLVRGTDPTGRGASKTFTYYVREKDNSSLFSHYKFDKSVYKITVTATDQSDKTIKCDVTYTKIVNADGKDIPENDQKAVNYVPAKDESTGKEQAVPTFTNTYSTSLPLSGMSGVTLTYLAGAAVLCAAAAWMHIRRKANAKGGKRRE